jgi:hypothetical protein
MSENRVRVSLCDDERREMAGEGGRPDQRPHDRFAFSLRVKPDRRRSLIPIDPERERRRR